MFNVPEQPQEEANFPLSWYKHIHCHYLWRDDITQGERQYLYIRLLISHTHTHTHTLRNHGVRKQLNVAYCSEQKPGNTTFLSNLSGHKHYLELYRLTLLREHLVPLYRELKIESVLKLMR